MGASDSRQTWTKIQYHAQSQWTTLFPNNIYRGKSKETRYASFSSAFCVACTPWMSCRWVVPIFPSWLSRNPECKACCVSHRTRQCVDTRNGDLTNLCTNFHVVIVCLNFCGFFCLFLILRKLSRLIVPKTSIDLVLKRQDLMRQRRAFVSACSMLKRSMKDQRTQLHADNHQSLLALYHYEFPFLCERNMPCCSIQELKR